MSILPPRFWRQQIGCSYCAVLSSPWLLNMKRLVTLKYQQRKTSKASSENNLKVRRQPLNREVKEETLECLKSWTELTKNEDGHWICKHLVYKNFVLCIYLNYRIFMTFHDVIWVANESTRENLYILVSLLGSVSWSRGHTSPNT